MPIKKKVHQTAGKIKKINIDLFKDFFESEKASGYILVLITVVSLLLANSALGKSYLTIWHTYMNLSFSGVELKYSIEHWINDGFMAVFFLLVGLEIEREIYVGELREIKKASLPIIAAIGGMLIPGIIHFVLNAGTETQSGFGIPMATDIAFAIGILSLAGSKVPLSLKIFLTALAIIDDLGAIILIAVFYTQNLALGYLFSAVLVFILLVFLNRMRVNKLSIYLILGVVMWYCMLKSGVHATISGVLLAFAVPFNKNNDENISYRLQKKLHWPVAFIILPLFALANTAVVLPKNIISSLTELNSLGIILGLVAGKFLGIFSFSFLSVKSGLSSLPSDLNWKLLGGAAVLAGIGFTMSIFISNLAFDQPEVIVSSKLSILFASVVSAVSGLTALMLVGKKSIPE